MDSKVIFFGYLVAFRKPVIAAAATICTKNQFASRALLDCKHLKEPFDEDRFTLLAGDLHFLLLSHVPLKILILDGSLGNGL